MFMYKSKKLQISIFIVLTTIIVVSGIGFFFISDKKVALFEDTTPSGNVKRFVEECIYDTSNRAQNLIGFYGGHLYKNPKIYASNKLNDEINKKAKGINFLDKIEIDYWYYYDDDKEDFITNIPDYSSSSKYSIKNQIATYVYENINSNCINNFNSFESLYKIKYELEELKINVDMRDDLINVRILFPLEITEKNTQKKEFIDTFENKVENKILVPYQIAKLILENEKKNIFLERVILNLIPTFQSYLTKEDLPPFYDFILGEYDYEPWKFDKTKNRLLGVLNSNLGILRFSESGSKKYTIPKELEDNEFAKGFIKKFDNDFLNLDDSDIKNSYKNQISNYDISTNFEVFFPNYIRIFPNLGNSVLFPNPRIVPGLFPLIYTEYKFFYDITLPVYFEIKSNNRNDDFVFNLFIESNIKNNKPLEEFLYESETLGLNFGEYKDSTSQAQSLICSNEIFDSGSYSFEIYDPIKRSGVNDATITFNCANIETCYLGKSKTSKNGKTIFETKLPSGCSPGTIEIYKNGHTSKKIEDLNPISDISNDLGKIIFPSKKEVLVEVLIKDLEKSVSGNGRKLYTNESGFITFTNKDDETDVVILEINKKNQFNGKVNLSIANYKVNGFLNLQKEIIIPEEEKCYKQGGLFPSDKCSNLDEINLDSWISGSINLEEEVKLINLEDNVKLVVEIQDIKIPNNYDDLINLNNLNKEHGRFYFTLK